MYVCIYVCINVHRWSTGSLEVGKLLLLYNRLSIGKEANLEQVQLWIQNTY